jgi:tetratricopeptide (TPR) repeat protein
LQGEIRKKLADMYYVRGIDRWLAQDFADALASFRSALANDNDHAPTRRKIEEMRQRADAFFEDAERLRASDPERAKSLYHLVLQLLPASAERYTKAKQRLEAKP